MASHGFGHQRSWGTFSYTVFWCILFDWATLSVPVYWVDTSFSCQEHSFSDKAPKQTSFDEKSNWGSLRHGFEDLQWIYHVLPVFAKFIMFVTVGNVDILGLDIESSGLNSVILSLRGVQLAFPYFGIWTSSRMLLYDFHDRCLENPSLRYLHGLFVSWEWSLQLYDIVQENTRDRILFPSILDSDTGGSKPSVQLEPLPVYCFLTLSCVSAWLLRSPQ